VYETAVVNAPSKPRFSTQEMALRNDVLAVSF
jgi:hypothetical protein